MTHELIKFFLITYPIEKNKIKIIRKYLEMNNLSQIDESIMVEYNKRILFIEIMDACFSLLSEQENFVINLHIIEHYTWNQVASLFEEKWGKMEVRSERTLKRIQKRAIDRIINFIINDDIEKYIPNEYIEM